ncbi:hypothetical protein [Bifidobacterium aerophilum]|uniref:Uncharacterized protein n=1 Tax=Bifidobacterium aerophilum TaxID=1798155 RepID=A0A6N9Z8H5_9BIFI|nr:hypothetical protein [Bifidobacterium aerophilum]NEG90584.1 hypothetical protein [Bifidobacterium aerophilum]
MISQSSLMNIIGRTIQKYDHDLTDDLYIIDSNRLDSLCMDAANLIIQGEKDIEQRDQEHTLHDVTLEITQLKTRVNDLEKRVWNLETKDVRHE